MQPRRSLKARALQLLAQRDQSRVELRKKLLRHLRSAAATDRGDPSVEPGGFSETQADAEAAGAAAAAQIDPLLDWLEAEGYLSNERFAESRVHARRSRFGLLRIKSELGQHQVALAPELERALADTELERAAAVRARRFAALPRDAAECAAQSRFLLARGFGAELVHRLMRSLGRAPAESQAPGSAPA
jgi:regulatory protein